MTTAFTIPTSSTPQQLSISLGGVKYTLTTKWNVPANCWVLDIADVNNNPIVSGICLVTGVDLLEQYGYLNFGGKLYVQTDHDINAVPTLSNFGTTGHLYFVTAS